MSTSNAAEVTAATTHELTILLIKALFHSPVVVFTKHLDLSTLAMKELMLHNC